MVSPEEGEMLSKKEGVMFIETSAKAGFNVKALFRKLATVLPGMETNKPEREANLVDVHLAPQPSNQDSSSQAKGCCY